MKSSSKKLTSGKHMNTTSAFLLEKFLTGSRLIAGAPGMETQPENSKQCFTPSSEFNKHAESMNGFSVGWGPTS